MAPKPVTRQMGCEKRSGVGPIAIRGSAGTTHDFPSILDRAAGEDTKFDQLCGICVVYSQLLERFVQGDHSIGCRNSLEGPIIKFQSMPAASRLLRLLFPRDINKYPPHRLRC